MIVCIIIYQIGDQDTKMSTFKDFLAENAHQAFDLIAKLHTIDDLLERHVKFIVSRKGYIKAFEDAVKAGDVLYNVVHVEAKDAAKEIFSKAYDSIVQASSSAWTRHDGADFKVLADADLDVPWHLDAGNAKKADRTLTAAEKLVNDAGTKADFVKLRRLVEAYIYFIEAFKATQTKVVKGRKPAPVDPNAFHSTMGTAHSVAVVRTQLLKSITAPLDSFERQLKDFHAMILKDVDEACRDQAEIKPFHSPFSEMVFQATYSSRVKRRDDKRVYTELQRYPTADAYPAKEAASARKNIEETFLHKNALKLSSLLDKKGNLTAINVLPGTPVKLHQGAGTLTSEMEVIFADGSRFNVRNKVIINTSAVGRPFYQYPTTFHDVKLADGAKLESPSEEKMVKVFGHETDKHF